MKKTTTILISLLTITYLGIVIISGINYLNIGQLTNVNDFWVILEKSAQITVLFLIVGVIHSLWPLPLLVLLYLKKLPVHWSIGIIYIYILTAGFIILVKADGG